MGYRTARAASDIIIKYLLNFCLINGGHYSSKYSEKGQTKKAAFTMFKVSLAATTILGVIVGLIATSIFFGSSSLTLLKGAMIGLGSGVVAGAAIGGSVGLKTYISYRNQFASAGFGAGKKAAKDGIEKTRELLKGVQKEVMTEHGMSDNVEIVGSKDKEKKEEPVEKREKLSANIANKEKAEKNVKENAANDANNKDSSSANDGNKEAEVDSDGFSSTRRPIYNAPYAIPAYTHPVGMSYSRYPAMHMNSGIMPTVGHMPYSYMNQYPLAGGVPLVGGVNYPSQVITPFYPYSHNLDGPVTHNLNIVRETGFGNNWRDKVKNQLNNSMTHGSNAYAQQHISY